jgi:hypothetical protein
VAASAEWRRQRGSGEAVAKTTMTTTSDAHVGGGTIDTTIKK